MTTTNGGVQGYGYVRGYLLYLLLSGDALYLGLFLVGIGVLVAAWHRRLGRSIAAGGLVLALVSAAPIHPSAYVVLAVSTTAWELRTEQSVTMRRSTDIALILAVLGVVGAALAMRSGSRLAPPRDNAVFVLGDSLSAGLGASKEGTWPQVLSARVGLRVTNLAQPGAALGDGPSQAHAIPKGPATVLVELGGNDLLAGTTPARFGNDLRSLLAMLAARDRHIMMFELPLLPFQNEFGRIQHEACQEYGVTLVPRSVLAGALTLPGHANDGLHLSAQGHSWVAERMSAMWLGR